jgi:Alkaline phosphatase PhoX
MKRRNQVLLTVLAGVVLTASGALATTSVKPYVVAVGSEYTVTPLFSANDSVPEASTPSLKYRMVGIPDGLGVHSNGDGTSTLYMNHELGFAATSSPLVDSGGSPSGPAYRGALVSKWTLDANGNPTKGERAYDWIFDENTFLGPAPDASNVAQMPRQFGRFCSGTLAGPPEGLSDWIYFANEEVGPAESFDGKGGLAVAIVNNALYTLPKLGRFSWENTVMQPNPGNKTVIMGMEDGPAALDPSVANSQFYMYVGKKDPRNGASVLRRNGLDNGDLYVLVPADPDMASEAQFTEGAIDVEWKLIPNAEDLTDPQLESATDAVGAFTFARPEDGAFNKRDRDEYFFVTTGDAGVAANKLGRLYSLRLNPGNPTQPGKLTLIYDADDVIAAGGDVAISPDNIGTSDDYLMINEDGTGASRPVMASLGRDGSVWRFDIEKAKVGVDADSGGGGVGIHPPGCDGAAVGPGIWETSGIVDASPLRPGWWLSDVQAHSPTPAPAPGTVEDGQLFLLRPAA